MSSVLAVGSVHEAVLARVRELINGYWFDSGPGGLRSLLTVYDGIATRQPVYPYLLFGESANDSAFNTLGPDTGSKWGAEVSIRLRIVTQYPTSTVQTYRMMHVLKAWFDLQPLTVPGFNSVAVTFGDAALLSDVINGVPTRELVASVDVLVHQG